MTDEGINEIYALAEAALLAGQPAFEVHAFPFRLTDAKLMARAHSSWWSFWSELKRGYDLFEQTHRPPQVWVEEGSYQTRAAR